MTRVALDIVTDDPKLGDNFVKLNEVINGGISLDNFRIQTISGTTSTTPDTEKLFNHSSVTQPSLFWPMRGDVYCQSIDKKYVDVRSTKPDVNFTGLLLIGNGDSKSVVAPPLTAVGGDDYKTTDEQATSAIPTPGIGDLDDAQVAQNPGISTTIGGSIVDCVTDGTYFYMTNTGVVNYLIRINRSTGIVDSLALGSLQLGRMLFDGSTLYVCQYVFDGANNVSVFQINTSTFTSSATHTATGTGNTQAILGFYKDGSHFYFSSKTATGNSRIHKFAIGGGASTVTTLGSTNKAGLDLLAHTNGFLYVTENDTGVSATRIYKVNKSTLAVDTTYTTPNRRVLLCRMQQIDNYIVMPAMVYTTKSATSQAITYGTLVVLLNTTTGDFTATPIMAGGGGTDASFPGNIVYDEANGYLYLAAAKRTSSSGFGVIVIQADVTTGTQRSKWYPISTTPQNASAGLNNVLIKDTDGTPILIADPGTTGDNFVWMPISFDDAQDTQDFGNFF